MCPLRLHSRQGHQPHRALCAQPSATASGRCHGAAAAHASQRAPDRAQGKAMGLVDPGHTLHGLDADCGAPQLELPHMQPPARLFGQHRAHLLATAAALPCRDARPWRETAGAQDARGHARREGAVASRRHHRHRLGQQPGCSARFQPGHGPLERSGLLERQRPARPRRRDAHCRRVGDAGRRHRRHPRVDRQRRGQLLSQRVVAGQQRPERQAAHICTLARNRNLPAARGRCQAAVGQHGRL